MARNSSNDWLDHLLLVLLGLRTTIKSDLDACPAELVYGSPLRLSGELLAPSYEPKPTDIKNLLQRLRKKMNDLQAIPTARQSSTTSYMDPRLNNCTHVFLRCDKVKRSLQPPYDGPFLPCMLHSFLLVLSRSSFFCMIGFRKEYLC